MLEFIHTYSVDFKVHEGLRFLRTLLSKNVKKMCHNIQTFLKSIWGILIPSSGKRESLSIHDESMKFFPCIDFNSSSMTVTSFLEENWQKGNFWGELEFNWIYFVFEKNITNNHNFKIIPKYSCTCICFFYVKFFVKHDCHVIFWIYLCFCLSDFNYWRRTWCSLWAPTFI